MEPFEDCTKAFLKSSRGKDDDLKMHLIEAQKKSVINQSLHEPCLLSLLDRSIIIKQAQYLSTYMSAKRSYPMFGGPPTGKIMTKTFKEFSNNAEGVLMQL